MNNLSIRKYEKLLYRFQKLSRLEEDTPTILEVSGYPNLENVASNILGFFFDTKQKHNLGDLFLKSLVDFLPDNEEIKNSIIETINVFREKTIEQNKRIDLIIECENTCFSIENKLFHELNNDLVLYERSIENRYKGRKIYHIVLSLRDENVSGSFINITYENFFSTIKTNLGHYSVVSNNTYLLFLLDFIKTIERYYKVENINKEMFQFIVEHSQDLKEIELEKDKLKQALLRVIGKVQQKVECNLNNYKSWVYAKYVLVYDFNFDNRIIAVDVVFDFNQVVMKIGARNGKGKSIIDNLALVKNNSLSVSGNHRIVFDKKINFFEIDLDQFSKEITGYLDQIYLIDANKEIS